MSDIEHRTRGAEGRDIRLLILGDSWVHGLVSEQDRTFGKLLAERLGATSVLDLSEISRTSMDTAEGFLDDIERFRPTVAIVNVGGTDALVFPRPAFQRVIDRFAPPDWQGLTGLAPRVRFSARLSRRIRQLLEQQAKILLKWLLINLFGGQRRRPAEETEEAVAILMSALAEMGTLVVCVGFAGCDERLHPRSDASLAGTNAMLERAAGNYPGAIYVPSAYAVKRWEDFFADRLHLNPAGHALVAQLVIDRIAEKGHPWDSLLPERRTSAARSALRTA